MTKQEVFDKVVRGLASQGYQTSMRGGTCKYRGEGGRKCALGHLIPDALYVPCMDEPGPAGLAAFQATMAAVGLPDGPMDSLGQMIIELRYAHDCDAPDWLPRGLRSIGTKHGLVWPSDVPVPA